MSFQRKSRLFVGVLTGIALSIYLSRVGRSVPVVRDIFEQLYRSTPSAQPIGSRAPQAVATESSPSVSPEELVRLLRHDSEEVRKSAAVKLGGLGAAIKPFLPEIFARWRSEKSVFVSSELQTALEHLGADLLVEMTALIDALRSEDGNTFIVGQVASAIQKVDPGNPTLVKALTEMALGGDSWKAAVSCQSLAQIGTAAEEAFPALLSLVKTNSDLQSEAARAAMQVDPSNQEVMPFLLDQFRTGTLEQRRKAAWAFVFIGTAARDALPYLMDALAGKIELTPKDFSIVASAVTDLDPQDRGHLTILRRRAENGTEEEKRAGCRVISDFLFINKDETQWRYLLEGC